MSWKEYNKIRKQGNKLAKEIDSYLEWNIPTREFIVAEMLKMLEELNDNLIKNTYMVLKIKSMECIAETLIKSNQVDLENQIISIYNNSNNYFKEKNINFYSLIYEKIYIDNYQYFELYISSLFQKLYTAFPAFLVDFHDEKYNNISIEIDSEVEKHIENNTQSIMRANIWKIINKFKNVFGMNINNIQEEDMKSLYVISQNRNLLIHNDGFVNNQYLDNLRERDIGSQYLLGDRLNIVENEEINQEREIIYKILKDLNSDIRDSWDDIINNYLRRIKSSNGA